MVLNFRGYPHFVRVYVKLNQQHERRIYFNYEKKHLSVKVPVPKKNYLTQKLEDFIEWYDHFTGMDEVRAAQRKVLEDKERFKKTQESRRIALSELNEIQKKLKEVLTEIDNTGRGDERYLVLVTKEHNLIKEEKISMEKFKATEKLERECFSALSSSLKDSHERERAQGERTKYWSIIASVLGTVLGVIGSSINNHFKMKELQRLILSSTNGIVMDSITSYLALNEKVLQQIETQRKEWDQINVTEITELLDSLSKKLTKLETSLKNQNKTSDIQPSESVSGEENNVTVTAAVASVEESIKKEYNQTKLLLFTLIVLNIIMPIVSKYS